jgi:hypothetical protein
MSIAEYTALYEKHNIATHELMVQHNTDSVAIHLGDGEILTLPLPTLIVNMGSQELRKVAFPPDMIKSLEGEPIGKSFTDLTLDRVAIVDWTVYSDNEDNEQWTVLSWVIAQKGSSDEKKHIQANIELMENVQRLLENNLNVEI